ncbi:MAG: hypothetical protein AUI11_03455 [Acidobacteria bacterium 13_2_20CM_2_66_4]|nr:MAG: hypothetical protein AUI11_03455 [Acidobacteria bacterium 13_2_20CM_2_66_4]
MFFVAVVAALRATPVVAQTLTQRGFVEAVAFGFPQEAPNDRTRLVGGFLAREEAFFKPAPWIQFAGGVDLRADSHAQVEDRWRVDIADRGAERPRLSVRRASAAIARGPLTVDAGKQFIRWGKTDIITPTDRFAPRDFLNVVDNELLAVTGVRAVAQLRSETFEAVWVPHFTPSRVPLLHQRWAVVPADVAALPIVQIPATLPGGSESGVRWSHVGAGFEYAASFFDGFNHLPTIDRGLIYPAIRMYGADAAAPTRWFTIKAEAAYFTSSSIAADEYILYVVQIERQTGEWVLVGGYAGEAVTERRGSLTFAPDRGLTRSVVGRASYTLDVNRSIAFEGAFRQNGDGEYAKLEYSQARGQHWRATLTTVGIGGHADDFLGQYHRNSHFTATVRYSF